MIQIRENDNFQCLIWNMIGSIVAASSSFILLLFVTRAVGAKEGGIFSLAFATAQILLTIGKFGVRSFQATDVKKEIDFGVYLQSRIWFCMVMILLSVFFVLLLKYNFYKGCVFISVSIIKMVDALEDVFHGQLQNIGKLDVAGKLLTIRNLFTIATFGIFIIFTKNLLLTCVVTAITSLVIGGVLNVVVTNRYIKISYIMNWQEFMVLFKSCLPLFVGSFLSLYIYNAPKYAIDKFGSEEEITYYSIIFMPTFVINLFSEFIFKPMLTQIAIMWREGSFKEFHVTILKLLANIGIITFLAMGFIYLYGAQILSVIYKVDILKYRKELIILIFSGGFSAAVYLLYNVLTSMRLQKTIICNYGIATVMITILAFVGVKYWKIAGAAYTYLITEIFLFCIMICCTYLGYKKGVKNYENRDYNVSGNE